MTIQQRRLPSRAGVGAGVPVVDIPTRAWQLSAWCGVPSGVDPDLAGDMYDAFDEPTAEPGRLEMVRALCSACEVRRECRDFAMAPDGPRHGFLGGLTPEERKARRAGDTRPHEELVTDAPRATGTHGGPRRGAGWAATEAVEAAREGTG